MAVDEKLLKSLEFLKNSEFAGDASLRNKEKLQYCSYVADSISSSSVKALPNFQQLLTTTFEVLLHLCDDNESDVRLMAEASLNKIIKAMDNENTNRVLIELHKEIKKNGLSRSLKAALWRFSYLADLIRLPKRRQYLINFIPCLISLSRRKEELIHEALMNGLPKILKSLGNFLTENDVKTLLNAFLKNIDNTSAVIRRTSVHCLVEICINCRKSFYFLSYLLDVLLDLLISKGARTDVCLILGILYSLKHLIPYINKVEGRQEIQGSFGLTKGAKEMQVSADKLVQVYQVCLHFLLYPDDSIMSASLDTLNSLLRNCPQQVKSVLLSPSGITAGKLSLPTQLYIKAESNDCDSKNGANESSGMVKEEDGAIREDIIDENCPMEKVIRVTNLVELCRDVENLDIGSIHDRNISLAFGARLICKSCLLVGRKTATVSDADIRISVKNLALTCLASLFRIYPDGFLLSLNKNRSTDGQPLSDILLLADHLDPQLRGTIRIVAASFLKSVLICSAGRYEAWFSQNAITPSETFRLQKLLSLIGQGLSDGSSSCVRQSLTALDICLKYLLRSSDFRLALPLLELLPTMAKDSHWLVKVKLLEVFVQLPFLETHSTNENTNYQERIVFGTVFDLLADEDERVRTFASKTITEIVPQLYVDRRMAVDVAIAKRHDLYFSDLELDQNDDDDSEGCKKGEADVLTFVPDTVVAPFDVMNEKERGSVKDALTKIVSTLRWLLATNLTNNTIVGYVQVLCRLSVAYPTTVYRDAWNTKSNADLLGLVACLLDHELVYDLRYHAHVLRLYGNLVSGACVHSLCRQPDVSDGSAEQRPLWAFFSDKFLRDKCETFLMHIVKLLNVFVHVIEDASWIEQKSATASNSSTVGGSSPLKVKKSGGDVERIAEKKTLDEEEKTEKKNETNKTVGYGHFSNSVHYVKIFKVLKVAYSRYKTTLSDDGSENVVDFLGALLKSLEQILEVATVVETSRIAEEILSYLQTIFSIEPTASIACVHQLLRSLFGANLTATVGSLKLPKPKDVGETTMESGGLYYYLSRYHYDDMFVYLNLLERKNGIDKDESGDDNSSTMSGYSRKKERSRPTTKPDKMLANYIRLFEPMVIRSLKHYTITNNIDLQCAVLRLLNQLVRLKVNYCLLDSEQVFIKFIQKQFEFIEEGLVVRPEALIPRIFEFLMNLSHGKQHSKSIIGVPKVIQLCDGLMASGQAPLTYCIPALRPIVANLFIRQNCSETLDFEELEITREVLLSMLLRLFDYSEVMDLLRTILSESQRAGNAQKWTNWSRQTFDIFLARLTNNNLKLEDAPSMLSLLRWLIALHPGSFSPPHEMLVILFEKFPAKEETSNAVSRWLGKVIVITLMIVRLQESILLKAIRESSKDFSPESVFEGAIVRSDPLNVTHVGDCFDNLSAEIIFVKFVLRTLELISSKCSTAIAGRDEDEPSRNHLIQQLSHFLWICQHIYQSGNFRVIAETTAELIGDRSAFTEYRSYLESINRNFLTIRRLSPSLTYQWCSILTTLNFRSRSFWTDVMSLEDGPNEEARCDGQQIEDLFWTTSSSAAIFSFCEYLTENNNDPDELMWFISNNARLLVWHCEEPPVADLIQYVHREAASSSHFMKIVIDSRPNNSNPNFVIKLLTVLQNSHTSQTGTLVRFLIGQLLNCRHLALLRTVVNLTCRKLEYLLTLDDEEVKLQMSQIELRGLVRHFVDNKLVKKNETILGLLRKLCTHVYDDELSERERQITFDALRVRDVKINKDWYLTQLTSKDCLRGDNSNLAAVFSRIDAEDVIGMRDERSKQLLLKSVLTFASSNVHEKRNSPLKNELLSLSIENTFCNLVTFLKGLPKHHQVYLPEGRSEFPEEQTYARQFEALLQKDTVRCDFDDLVTLVYHYASCFGKIDRADRSSQTDNFSIVLKFCVVCLESIVHRLFVESTGANMDRVDRALRCVETVLNVPEMITPLALRVHLTWLCSSVNSLYRLTYFLLPDYVAPLNLISSTTDIPGPKDTTIAKHANRQLATLFGILEKNCSLNVKHPAYKTIRGIVVRLSKIPILNSYLLTPTSVWKGSKSDSSSHDRPVENQQHPLPVDFLKDTEILEEYNFRISRVGWSSRKQFEETWMSLLSVLNSGLIDENESVYSTSFAIKTITALLARTLCDSISHSVNDTTFFHVSRDTAIPETNASVRRLKSVQDKFEKIMKAEANFLTTPNVTTNVFDKPNVGKRLDAYSGGQISIAYLLLSSKAAAEDANDDSALRKIYTERQTILAESELDLNSCVQSLLDLYSQWIKLQKTQTPKILDEILKSLLVISDLFQQRSQFLWMLDTCIELSKSPLLENEILSRYLIIALCKAAAVLNPDMEIYELIKRIIVQHLRSTNLSVRISCLQALLYVLEGCILTNTIIGGLSDELQLVLPLATDYIELFNETNDARGQDRLQEHNLTVWALTFFILEHVRSEYLPSGFATSAIVGVLTTLKKSRLEARVYSSLMKALERLIIKSCLPVDLCEQITKLALDKIKDSNALQSFLGTQLLITCMYSTDYVEIRRDEGDNANDDNPDNLIQTVEKVSTIFDRMRKGLPFEVEVFCHVLPDMINDFFSPADILTKIVGEFLSQQQKHPALLSRVVFQVFENSIARSQLALLQDWVVVSLSNFTQTFSAGMAAWYLTCFFISASENFWLRSIFPYVRSRIGRFEREDREMLCIAGLDFYNNLTTEKQRQVFVDAFRKAKDDFSDLLDCL